MPEEQQDLNEFKRWDAVGAAGFLAIVPAVMYWVFVEHDVVKVAGIGAIAGIATAVVLVLSLIFPERVVGSIVNKIGAVLAPVYLLLAIWLFCLKWGGDTQTPAPATPSTPAPELQQENTPTAN